MTAIALPRMPVFLDIVISPLTNDAAVRPAPPPAEMVPLYPIVYTPKTCRHARHTQYGYVEPGVPQHHPPARCIYPFSAPESHQSNGMRAWNIHIRSLKQPRAGKPLSTYYDQNGSASSSGSYEEDKTKLIGYMTQSVERLPPICSISAANCLRPWPPGRLPECQAPISFTSVISKECVFTRTDTSYLPPEDA